MVDLPVPEGPIIPVFLLLISRVRPLRITLLLSLGYAKVTFSKWKIPKKASGIMASVADLIYGFLSITLMIAVIAFFPSLIEWMEGKSCWTFNAGNRIHNNMHRTFPPVYLGSAGQIFEPLTHSDPYQKAKANIPKKQKQENKCIHENTFTWFYIFCVL